MIIVFGTDGSVHAHHAIREAARLLALKDAQLFVVSVAGLPVVPMEAVPGGLAASTSFPLAAVLEQAERAAEASLAATSAVFEELGLQVTTLDRLGDPAEELMAVAHELQADLIVVGSHGYGALKRLVVGSVSDRVTHHAPSAVMVVHLPK